MSRAIIDLCGIKPYRDEKPKTKPYKLSARTMGIEAMLLRKYREERQTFSESCERLFDKIHQETFEKIDSFVNEAITEETLFPGQNAYLLQAATLILGLHTSDHHYTLDKLESHFDSGKVVETFRIKPKRFQRRTDLIESINKVRDVDRLLVIVEQTEILDAFMLECFIDSLYNMLILSDDKRILILFCMSGSFMPISSLLPVSVMNRMAHKAIIVNDVDDITQDLERKLIANDGLSMKLGHRLISFMYMSFTEKDASIMHLKYLIENCLFEHYSSDLTIVNLPKESITKVLNQNHDMINRLKRLKSLKNCDMIDWKSVNSIVNFCTQQTEELQKYHKYLAVNINYMFELLKDQHVDGIITDLSDIYQQLLKHDNLSQSSEIYDQIINFKKYSPEAILKRIKSALRHQASLEYKGSFDIHKTLTKYLARLENNENCKEIVVALIKDLLQNAASLKNPLKLPLSELIYFDDIDLIMSMTMPATRNSIIECKHLTNKNYYEVLLDTLQGFPEEVNVADLFEEFKNSAKEEKLIILEASVKEMAEVVKKDQKRSKRSVHYKVDENEVEESDELMRAIFTDLIDGMELQGIVKRYANESKQGILKRMCWL